MNKSILIKLGLNDKEIEIYLFLTKSEVQTVKQISVATFINRTTAYRYLESLEKKGLIEWIIDERGKKVKARPPDSLALYLNSKKTEIKEIENTLPDFITQLNLVRPSEKLETQVRYYKGKEGVEQMIWNTLQTKETMRSFTPLVRREHVSISFENEFEEEWGKRNLKDRVITNDKRLSYLNRLVNIYKNSLNIRTIPSKKFYITNDIAIFDNTLSIISFEKENSIGVEIENAEIAKTQKSIFDIVWETAKPITSYQE